MKTKLILGAAAALAMCVPAHAQTTYAVVPMEPVPEVNTSTVAIDNEGKVLTANMGAFDTSIEYGALCTAEACKQNSPRQRPGHWRGMSSNHAFAGQAFYEGSQAYWAIYRPPGGQVSRITTGAAWAVNRNLQVVGQTGHRAPFTYANGLLLTLATLGGAEGAAYSVNDSGRIVGESDDAAGKRRATVWVNAVPYSLSSLASSAKSVNEVGNTVGCATQDAGATQVAVHFKKTYVKVLGAGHLGTGANNACALHINDEGVIVGWSQVMPDPDTHAFVIEDETMVDLNDRIPVADRQIYKLLSATGVNKKGQISVTARRMTDHYVVALRLDPQ